MVRLMTADDAFAAKIVAAQLGGEGIVWQLKGGVDGPYPFGPVHIYVPETEVEEARAVLAAAAPLDDDEEDDEWRRSVPHRRALLGGAALVGLLGLAAAELVRMLVLR